MRAGVIRGERTSMELAALGAALGPIRRHSKDGSGRVDEPQARNP